MKIKLKGNLDYELTRIGLAEGDEIEATPDRVGKTGAVYFQKYHRGTKYDCVAWPDNYDVINK